MILKTRPKCYFCHAPSNPGEYCYGCGYNVCDNCDKLQPVGKHDVKAHQELEEGADQVNREERRGIHAY
jgi:hypothetical protein